MSYNEDKYIIEQYSGITTPAEGLAVPIISGTSLGSGIAVYKDKNERVLEFKSLKAGNNITLTPSSTGITISSTGGVSGNFVSASTFNQYTGTTAPSTYLSKVSFNSFTGGTSYIRAANNGLTKVGSNIYLGGSLSGDTSIGGSGHSLTLGTSSNKLTTLNVNTSSDIQFVGAGNVQVGKSTQFVRWLSSQFDLYGTSFNLFSNATNTVFTDSATTPRGLQYLSDYSSTYATRSLVDKGYVTTQLGSYQTKASITTYTGTTAPGLYASRTKYNTLTGTTLPATYQTKSSITTYTGTTVPNTYLTKTKFNTYTASTGTVTASNGLIKSGNDIQIGDSTFTNGFVWEVDGNAISIQDGGNEYIGYDPSSGVNLVNVFAFGQNVIAGDTGVPNNTYRIDVNNGGILFSSTGSITDFAGAQYADDYSANFTDRSLVDKYYVDNNLSLTANNGITKTGSNLYLGGALTGDTVIGDSSGVLTFSLDQIYNNSNDYQVNSGTIELIANSDFLNLQGTNDAYMTLQTYNGTLELYSVLSDINIHNNNTNASIYIQSDSGAGLQIAASGITVSGGLIKYDSDRSGTYSARSLVDKAYVDSVAAGGGLNPAIFNTYTGTTAPATYALKSKFNTYTGTTAPATYQTKSSIATLTGTTLPATYQSKSSIATYTGTTAPNQFASKTNFNTFTGTTAPATYAAISNDLSTVNVVPSASITLNLNSYKQRHFIITGTTVSTTLTFSNTSNVQVFSVDLDCSGSISITMPSTVRMQTYEVTNSRWVTATHILTLAAGKYTLTFSYDGSVYRCNASDLYV